MVEAPTFRLHSELSAWKSGDGEDSMRIGGIVSTEQLDKQGEVVVQSGLDFRPFLKDGWFNDNHGQKTHDVLGYPTGAKYVRKGERLPNGKKATTSGWWAEGYLVNTPEGRKTFALCQALQRSPRKLGFSIEGKVTERDVQDDSKILSATVRNVAITHCPVNTGTEMTTLVKALTAGASIDNPGAAPGEGFGLRVERLQRKPATAPEPEEEPDFVVANLSDGDGGQANNGGIAGTSPHVSKAEGDTEVIADELSLIDEWAPAIQRNMRNMAAPTSLTKAEARVIVSERFPHLSADDVDRIVSEATQE